MKRAILTLAVGLLLATGLSACGGDEEGGGSNEPIEITVQDGDVTPKGERVEVAQGTVTFTVTADQAGSIHVHSSPEQEFDYETGTHDYEVEVDKPGVVEVESHEPAVVIVQLEVK